MEKAPHGDKAIELEKYASDLYGAVDFLFARRGIPSETGDTMMNRCCELHLKRDEIDFVQPAFVDNFIDPPQSVDISLVGLNPNIYPDASSGGVQIITQHEDENDIYVTMYTVWFTGRGSAYTEATKNTRSMPKLTSVDGQQTLLGATDLEQKIFNDIPIDPSEQAALSAMIAKL